MAKKTKKSVKKPRKSPAAKAKTVAKPVPVVHVISDSTANLPRHMMAALLTQFPAGTVKVAFHTFVTTPGHLATALGEVEPVSAVVCHAVVSPLLKRAIVATCETRKIPCHDLTGPLLTFLELAAGVSATADLKVLHPIDQAYRRRIGAMEFTLNHDDGLGVDTLSNADIVLAGVSRTGKTPTSILLAQLGYRTANVSLAKGVDVPASLLAVPKEKVVGLLISPSQLSLIRARRQQAWKMDQTTYDHPDNVGAEVAWSRALFLKQGWATLDVTDQAIEETAARIAAIVGPATSEIGDSCDLPE